jgi:hypothetical protein
VLVHQPNTSWAGIELARTIGNKASGCSSILTKIQTEGDSSAAYWRPTWRIKKRSWETKNASCRGGTAGHCMPPTTPTYMELHILYQFRHFRMVRIANRPICRLNLLPCPVMAARKNSLLKCQADNNGILLRNPGQPCLILPGMSGLFCADCCKIKQLRFLTLWKTDCRDFV